ncbi:NAD(P)H-binding protein [Kitasatospora sp. LaBMicrA B282]|uniref:NAD(P)H-binding protein n=1 Tax=Kitasatospora sp. LaBMicrA B282 TaxID=3420949 RepID=UPI003D147D31
MTILVTGARGRVSAAVLRELVQRGESVRAAGREPAAAGLPDGVQSVRLALADPDGFAAALDGVRKVFLYAEPTGIDAFLDAARGAGVEHVVLLSSLAAGEPDPESNAIGAFHVAAEQALIASGLAWTILRPGSFATNTLLWAPSIREAGVVPSAFPNTHNSPIHEQDIATVAVQSLLDAAHHGAVHALTGPESLTEHEMVDLLAEAVGRPIRIQQATPEEELARLTPFAGPEVAKVLVDYRAGYDGVPAEVHDGVREVTGRPALPFARWAADHAADFR